MVEFLAFFGVLSIIYIIGFAISLIIYRNEWMGLIGAFLWPLMLLEYIMGKFRK